MTNASEDLQARVERNEMHKIACIPSGSSALPPVPADRPPYGSNWIYLLELDGTSIGLEPVTRQKATVARILRNSRPGVRLNEHSSSPTGGSRYRFVRLAKVQETWRARRSAGKRTRTGACCLAIARAGPLGQ